MANLPKCSVVECESPVSKVGYTMCYKHWLADNRSKVTTTAEKVDVDKTKQVNFLTSTTLGEKFGIESRKLNQVLSELGWIERSIHPNSDKT